MKTRALKILMLLAVLAGSLASCKEKNTDDTLVKGGIIRYAAPPDNCNDYIIDFSIDEELSDFYKPSNLPNEFKADNLKVEVTYRMTEKKHNCGFGGDIQIIDIVEIIKIKQI